MMLKKFTLIVFIMFLSCQSRAQQWGDYTLYAVMNQYAAYLVDTNSPSQTYHSWSFPSTAKTGYSSYMLPGGVLLRTVARTGNSFSGGPICGQVQKIDWNGNVIWDYIYSTTDYCSHHDICGMPNGNVLLIAYERKSSADVIAAGCNTFSNEMWPDKVVEIQPTGPTTGQVVWEWKIWDHLVQNVDPTKANYQTSIINHPELLNINYQAQKDWIHMNGIDYNPMLDQIVVSSHNLDEWYVIDHSTTTAEAASHTGGNSGKGGDFLYRWGNPQAYGATGTAVLNVTHDSHWIPEGVPNAGRIVGFNNRGITGPFQSTVDQINPPVSGYTYNYTAGTALQPATFDYRLACTGYSSNMGSSQQLPNGNQLVCVATTGLIYEVNPAGTTLWSKQVTGSVPQSFRYAQCYLANTPPAIPVISESGGILNATTAATYQWYLNGQAIAGANSQSYTPTVNGIYLVRITDTADCFKVYSEGYPFSLTTSLSLNTGNGKMFVFPNPGQGNFVLRLPDAFIKDEYQISVTDLSGKIVFTDRNSVVADLSYLNDGIYFIKVENNSNQILFDKITLIK